MKKNVAGLFLAISCLMFVVGGCANNEMVKKEEPLAPTAKAVTQAKAEPVIAKPAGDQAAKPVLIKESTAQATPAPIRNADKLNAALEKIYFSFDSYDLSPEARNSLQKNMEIIKNSAASAVRIEGNCDERGSAEYNLALGEKRAKVAMQYLVTMGIPAEHLSVISYGKERPAVQGDNEAAWSKNRRDDLVIQK